MYMAINIPAVSLTRVYVTVRASMCLNVISKSGSTCHTSVSFLYIVCRANVQDCPRHTTK